MAIHTKEELIIDLQLATSIRSDNPTIVARARDFAGALLYELLENHMDDPVAVDSYIDSVEAISNFPVGADDKADTHLFRAGTLLLVVLDKIKAEPNSMLDEKMASGLTRIFTRYAAVNAVKTDLLVDYIASVCPEESQVKKAADAILSILPNRAPKLQ